jgi:nucleoid DNA-binding protein
VRKRELVSAIAAEVGLANDQVEAVLDSAFAHIANELIAGGRFEIRSLGVFNVLTQKARKQYVPKTGQTITIPARRVIRFKEVAAIKRRLNPLLVASEE